MENTSESIIHCPIEWMTVTNRFGSMPEHMEFHRDFLHFILQLFNINIPFGGHQKLE